MALRLSTGLVNGLMEESGKSLANLLDNGKMRIYTGSQPLSADAAETGTLLAVISSTCGTGAEDGLKYGTASSGVLPIGEPAWQGAVIAAGVAGWFRIYDENDVMGSNGTAVRLDGAIGVSGADLNLSHTNLALSSVVTITSGTFTMPKE